MKLNYKYSPLLLLFLLGVILLFSLENYLIFYPDRFPNGNWTPASIKPENIEIVSEDGLTLHGWYLKAKMPRAVALYSHGNGGNITGLADYLKILNERLNITILAYDYRGYGKSNGSPNVKGILMDAKAATNWLAKKEGIEPKQIVQIGRSLGGAVALQNALKFDARGLILENTFTSIGAMGKRIYPWLPVKMLLRNDLDSLKAIESYKGPLLIIHGDKDEVIPYPMGEELYQAANEPKQFLSIPGGRHNDFPPPYYFIEMDRFISRL